MAQLLGFVLLSLFITGVLLIPFIDFLYKMKFRRAKQKTVDMFNKPTPTFDKFNNWKVGTPLAAEYDRCCGLHSDFVGLRDNGC